MNGLGSRYVDDLEGAIRHRGAREAYFPADRDMRRAANLALARDVGYGLAGDPDQVIREERNSLYGRFVVRNSLDRTGVAISAGEWGKAFDEGLRRGRAEFSSR